MYNNISVSADGGCKMRVVRQAQPIVEPANTTSMLRQMNKKGREKKKEDGLNKRYLAKRVKRVKREMGAFSMST